MKLKKPQLVSIYSGAGGLDLGFKKAGFKISYATDNWEPACETLKNNSTAAEVVCDNIVNIDFIKLGKKLGIIDCLIGGPPCPSFSKSRFYLKNKKRSIEDENGLLTLTHYFRAVKELEPKIFFFENVHGFFYKPHRNAFELLDNYSQKLKYNIKYKIINSADYGVPQIRSRFICIGTKKGYDSFIFPEKTHINPKEKNERDELPTWVICKDAIGDLDIPLPEDKFMVAGSKHKDILKMIPPGQNYLFFTEKRNHKKPLFKWRSRYWSFLLKLNPNMPSWTIQASHSNNMGPFHWRNRFLRISEIKRIQTFPDNYKIHGDYITQWRLIGNAVPPVLAQKLALSIKKQFFS